MLLIVWDAVTGVTVVFVSFTGSFRGSFKGRCVAVRWSVARQLLAAQLAVVFVAVLAVSAVTVVDERRDSDELTR